MQEIVTPATPNEPGKKGRVVYVATLSGRELNFYLGFAFWPTLIAVGLQIIAEFASSPFYLNWLIDVIAIIYLIWKFVKREQGTFKQSLILGGVASVIIGLFLALFKFIYYRLFFYLFNLITEPVITGILGLIIAAATFWFVSSRPQKIIVPNIPLTNQLKNQSQSIKTKGGEAHGRSKSRRRGK